MRVKRVPFIFLLGLLIALGGCSSEDQVTDPTRSPITGAKLAVQSDLTPFQQSVQNKIAARAADGLPVPQVIFDYSSTNGSSLSALQTYAGAPGESYTITATTTIVYDNPTQAGVDEWPRIVFSGQVPPEEGYILEGDYTDAFKDYIAERAPGIWDTYTFGHEPRTRTVTETFTVTYPEDQSNLTVGDELVHGFTYTGPNIDWTVGDEACVAGFCAWYFRAGFALDWGFGMRLPMSVDLTSVDPVDEGTLFSPTSTAHGVNWSAADFIAAGIQPESGNEWVARYEIFLGIQVEVAEISIVDIGPDIDKDGSSSFTTPFGPGAVFSLPPVDAPVYQDNFPAVEFEFGVAFVPQGGSDKFKANWTASNDLVGNGSLIYTNPAVAQSLSSVYAVDGPATGNLQIKDSKYVFTNFGIGLGAYFEIDIFGLFDDRWDIPITNFNLSSIFPDVSVPIHAGTNPTTVDASVQIQNVAPTAEINTAGASLINGVHTFFGNAGNPVPFQGSSHDPGRDDLTLQWDFGDGAPSPDVTTNHLLGLPTGPHDVVENQQHAFAEACLYQVGFQSTDSDGASSQDDVAVVIRDAEENKARLTGYWQHQLKGVGQVEVPEDEMACLLEIVGFMSAVFDEVRDASTPSKALKVVHPGGNGWDETGRFDRVLLVAWLNFANNGFDLMDMVDTDGDLIPDDTFAGVLGAAEMVRLNPFATDAELQEQREIVHYATTQGNQHVVLEFGVGSKRAISDARASGSTTGR